MTQSAGQQHLLVPHLPALVVCVMALAAVAVWVGMHLRRTGGQSRLLRSFFLLTRTAAGFVAILAAMEAVQRVLVFATNWPTWPLALGGAVAVEAVLGLYGVERRVVPRRTGAVMASLRVALVLLVIVMLAQPVHTQVLSARLDRFVAVLVDDSGSMQVPDSQMTPAEKLRLADMLSVKEAQRPCRLDLASAQLRETREELAAHIDFLASLGSLEPQLREKRLKDRRKGLHESLAAAEKAIGRQIEVTAGALAGSVPLNDAMRTGLTQLRDGLTQRVREPLAKTAAATAEGKEQSFVQECDALQNSLRDAAGALGEMEPKAASLGEAMDEAFYASVPAEKRGKIDAAVLRGRFDLARDVLTHRAPAKDGEAEAAQPQMDASILDRLSARYGVRLYRFASEAIDVNVGSGLVGPGPFAPGGSPQAPGQVLPSREQTDLAGALQTVVTQTPADRLAGIILLTDGRHNGPTSPEPLARRIGLQRVPIGCVVFGGGRRPTTDAAIIAVAAPETVYTGDKLYISAELKLDGLAGKKAIVNLYQGEKPVDTREVPIKGDELRTRVELVHEPKGAGLQAYRVKVEELEGEVNKSNNERSLTVSVSDERARLLIVDGRPRWEFRYLKNLFANRDKTVQLQYVVLEPDRIEGQDPRAMVPASAARDKDQIEATALPAEESEWMKFDVIILGDIKPSSLREQDQTALRKFVEERGGTLIVIAGPRYMPHAFAGTPLAEVLPVSFTPVKDEGCYLLAPEESYRIALTSEGRESVIMRLSADAEENLATWEGLPDIHWRHPGVKAKEGAVVLAYALTPDAPPFLRPKTGYDLPAEETIARRREFEHEHALIAAHNAALGRVLFLSFDRTWRLRYRVGDTYHHRFWGQVLRWATADKLPAGTSLVRIGTDQPRYPAHSRIRARAKIVQPDYSPVQSGEVFAKVFDGNRLVLRRKMEYQANSAGIYAADLGELPPGTYRLELDAPAAKQMLFAEKVEKVSTEFSVESAVPIEQIELVADRGLLERMALLTGGVVVSPPDAAQVLEVLGPGTLAHEELRQRSLWDSWPFLVLIMLTAGVEWSLRKRARLP